MKLGVTSPVNYHGYPANYSKNQRPDPVIPERPDPVIPAPVIPKVGDKRTIHNHHRRLTQYAFYVKGSKKKAPTKLEDAY